MAQEILLSEESLRKRQRIVALRGELAELFEYRELMVSHDKAKLTALYIDLIGKLQYEEYALKVEVMRLKRKHQLIQTAINRGERPDVELIEQVLNIEFEEYQQQIEAQAENLKAARQFLEAPLLSEDETADMKRIYRLLVKRLHPDWNPDLSEERKELFIRAQAAFNSCDVQELRNILLMLEADEPFQIKAETIDDDIARLERSLENLRERVKKLEATFPFDHRDKLADEKWVEQKQNEIKESIATLTKEKRQWEMFIYSQTGLTIGEA